MATWATFWSAHDAEQRRRIRGCLGVPFEVTPWLWLRPMTPRDVLELSLIQSPFATGSIAQPEDTALFLWLMRHPREPRNVRGWFAKKLLAWRQYRFGIRVGRMMADELEDKLAEYMAMQLVDMGARKAESVPNQGGRRIEHCPPMMRMLVRVCGVSPDRIQAALDVPLVLIHQCQRAHDANEGHPLMNDSDALKLKIMLEGQTDE